MRVFSRPRGLLELRARHLRLSSLQERGANARFSCNIRCFAEHDRHVLRKEETNTEKAGKEDEEEVRLMDWRSAMHWFMLGCIVLWFSGLMYLAWGVNSE